MFHCFLVALAAERLILGLFADEHLVLVVHKTMTHVGERSALHADGVHLRHFVGYGAQSRYRAEGSALEVHVKAGYYHAHAVVGKLVAHRYEVHAEELRLVYAHHVEVVTVRACGVTAQVVQNLG